MKVFTHRLFTVGSTVPGRCYSGGMTNFELYTPDSLGFSDYLIDSHQSRLRYTTDTGRFYKYTGTHWLECNGSNVEIGKTVNVAGRYLRGSLPPKPEKDDPDFYAWNVQAVFIKLAGSAAGTSSVISKMKEDDRIWCHLNDFANRPYKVNFRNGTVDVREPWLSDEDEPEFYFHAHNPKDMLATVLSNPYPEFETPDTPLWTGMLMHMCGDDPEYALSLERALAYGLLGENPEQLMVFLVGEANIGKTQVLEVMTELAGSLGGHGKVDLIQYSRTGEHDSVRADLRGKHFVMLGETSHRLKLDEMKFKDLTGASYIPTRKLGQEPVSTRVTWTLYCATNELPEVPGEMDDAIARRLWIFTLPGKQIPKAERDTGLTQKIIQQEGAAILYRLARHLSEWYACGKRPEPHIRSTQALDGYRSESNTVAEFARAYIREEEGCWVSYDDLNTAYAEFCKKRSLLGVSRRMLPKKLSQVMMCDRDSSNSRLKGVSLSFEAPSWT